jgi:hypothetical protein
MVYYWMNGVILGYKRKEDIYKLLRNFLSRGVKVASYDRDELLDKGALFSNRDA